MKYLVRFSICILTAALVCVCAVSCNSNGSADKSSKKDSVAVPAKTMKKAKTNVVFERRLTWAERGLNGKVKSYSSTHYILSEKNGQVVKEMDSKNENHFDANGYLQETGFYKADSTLDYKLTIRYDAKGNDTEAYYTSGDSSFLGRSHATFDGKGNKIVSEHYELTGNAGGKELFKGKEVYKYDDKGNVIEADDYDEDTTLTSKDTYSYTDYGNKKDMYEFNPDDSSFLANRFKYDSLENNIESDTYLPDGTVDEKTVFKYDDKGQKTDESIYTSDTVLTIRWTFKYDDKGNKTEVIAYKPDGSVIADKSVYKDYEYDKAGNIIKETKFIMRDGKRVPTEMIESVVVYY